MADFDPRAAAARMMALQEGGGVPPFMQHYAGMAGQMLPDPRNQVPGMGSTAHALPPHNPMVEDRRYYTDMSDGAREQALLGLGGGMATMMAAPANPATIPLALALGAYGGLQGFRDAYGNSNARRLGYQGN